VGSARGLVKVAPIDHLLGLGEGPVGHGQLSSGHPDERPLRAREKPAGLDHYPRLGAFLAELGDSVLSAFGGGAEVSEDLTIVMNRIVVSLWARVEVCGPGGRSWFYWYVERPRPKSTSG
jgi:hypothetical protein